MRILGSTKQLLVAMLLVLGININVDAQGLTNYLSYPYVCIVDDGETPQISDEQFYDMAGRVVFPVNEYRLNLNDPLLRQLDQKVLPQVSLDSLELVKMIIRGAASPEGPTAYNKKLGEKRVNSLFEFVKSHLSVPVSDDCFTLDVEIEDYSTLCLLMKRSEDNDYTFVKSLCDKYLPSGNTDQLKKELQTARGGQLWKRLLGDYFPSLRTASIMLLFRHHPKPVVELAEAPAVEVPEPVVAVEPVIEAPAAMVIEEPEVLPRREYLSVKTNLLFDVAYVPGYNRWCPIPNVAVEYYPKKGHFTYGASLDFPWWQDYDAHKYFQIRNYQLETRYYLRSGDLSSNPPGKGAAFRGLYLQAYAHVALFGICFDADRGWVGEGAGAGVGLGYVTPISKNGHWRLEFGLQAGYFRCKYDPYQYENPVDPTYRDHLYYYKWSLDPQLFKKRQYRYNWLGPTRIGVTLTYDLLYRRISKKGVSFKNYEMR